MATVATIAAAACETGIGRNTSEIKLLQTIAVLEADLVTANVGLAVTPEAIAERACTSGIGKETDMIVLLRIIAQLMNDQQ